MNILVVWDADYPWDIRLEKVTDALMEMGHGVHLVARNKGRKSAYERYRGLHIHRLPALPRALGPLNGAFTFPAFFSPVWLREIYRQARQHQCGLIIVRDLPLALAGVLVARQLRIPIVLDMAEVYPEMLKNIWRFGRFRPHNVVVRNPWLAAVVERAALRAVDHVFVMIEESRDRLVRLGVDPTKISIVSNTPDLQRFPAAPSAPARPDRPLTVTYFGMVGFSRGLDIAIRAMALYRAENPGARLRIVGSGKAIPSLEKLIENLGAEDAVVLEGFVDNARLPTILAESDVCLLSHRRCGHWDHTIPNKLFDYMASSKPVLTSDVPPVRRIVEAAGCGLVYRDDDAADLALKLRALEDVQTREQLGRRGREAVDREYRWERDKGVLQRVVAEVVKGRRPANGEGARQGGKRPL